MTARTNVSTVLTTLEHERHAPGPLVAAFADELRAAIPEAAPESTRALAALEEAERGEMDLEGMTRLLSDLRILAGYVIPA